MATIFINRAIGPGDHNLWRRSNGARRRKLAVIVCGFKISEETTMLKGSLSRLELGKFSIICINKNDNGDERVLGIFLNDSCGYSVIEGRELYGASSPGGYGNSRSQFGIYVVGTLVEVYTYKHRNQPSYFRLTNSGWEEIPAEVGRQCVVPAISPGEIQEI